MGSEASRMMARHRPVSFARVAAIAANTLTELTRLKIFYVLLIFALVLIGSSVFLARFSFREEFQILKDVALGAMSIFSSLLAIIATARLIPQDIEDRIAYTILAKPVPRFEYVIGKLAGVLLLLAIGAVVMSAMFLAVLFAREQALLHETARQMASAPREQIEEALRAIHASAINSNILSGIGLIYVRPACSRRWRSLFPLLRAQAFSPSS